MKTLSLLLVLVLLSTPRWERGIITFLFGGHKWKEFIVKRNKNIKLLEQKERHHAFETLIDEDVLGSIVTPLNKATYFDTNNLVPTVALIKLLKKFFFLS
jgi:hypothetical protein